MDVPMNALTLIYQEPALPDNCDDIIQFLELGGSVDTGSNTGKPLDDIVRDLDLECFTQTSNVVPAAAIQYHQGAHQPTEIISYVDLTPPEIENSPYHISGGSLFINEANSAPASPQEVSLFVPTTPVSQQEGSSFVLTAPVENQDARKPAGGKTPQRRHERKVKLYEREEPMSDPEEEKKRLNAINAKNNREKQKTKLQGLENQAKSLTAERDALQDSNTKLINKSNAFEIQLKTICQQFNVPLIILPQD